MKKLLGILAATGLVATTSASAISCATIGSIKAEQTEIKEIGETVKLTITLKSDIKDGEKWSITSDAKESILDLSKTPTPIKESKKEFEFIMGLKGALPKEIVKEKLTIKLGESKVGDVTITIKNDEGTNLEDKTNLENLKLKELGFMQMAGKTPTIAELVEKINDKNKNFGLKAEDVEFEAPPTSTIANLKAKPESKNFTGKVTVRFVKFWINLKIIKEKNISSSNFKNAIPTLEELADAINVANSNIMPKLTKDDVDFKVGEQSNPTRTKATLIAKSTSNSFKGESEFTYNSNEKGMNLSSIKEKKISSGNFEKGVPALDELVNAINNENEDLNLTKDDVTLKEGTPSIPNPTRTKATLVAKDTSNNFKGEATFTYEDNKKAMDLSSIKEKKISSSNFKDAIPLLHELVDEINSVNSGLNLTKDDIQLSPPSIPGISNPTRINATLMAKPTSTNFKGEAEFNYNNNEKGMDLKSIPIKEISSSKFQKSIPTLHELVDAIIEANKGIELRALKFITKFKKEVPVTKNGATIIVNPDNNDFYGESKFTYEDNGKE